MHATVRGLASGLEKYGFQRKHDLLIQIASIQNRFQTWIVPLQIHTLGSEK